MRDWTDNTKRPGRRPPPTPSPPRSRRHVPAARCHGWVAIRAQVVYRGRMGDMLQSCEPSGSVRRREDRTWSRLRFIALLIAIACPAAAQIVEPGPEHYAIAYDSMAVALATERLAAAEEEIRRRDAVLTRIRALIEADKAHRDAVVDAWALEVQRRSGARVAYLPGTGWHEVHRDD